MSVSKNVPIVITQENYEELGYSENNIGWICVIADNYHRHDVPPTHAVHIAFTNMQKEIERLEAELKIQDDANDILTKKVERLEAALKEATERGDFFQLENQKHLQELVSAIEWRPIPKQPDKKDGWTLEYDFLDKVRDKIDELNPDDRFSEGLGLEEVQEVLLAYELYQQSLPLPKPKGE